MKKVLAVLTILAVSLFAVSAFAYDVKVDDDTFAKVGVKAQIRYTMTNPDSNHDRVDVTAFQGRFYAAGQVTNMFKFGLNFDMGRTATPTVFEVTSPTLGPNTAAPSTQTNSLSDAFILLDFAKEFKLMTGVYRMAVSRVALQDSYQFILIEAPEVAHASFLSNGLASFRNAGLTLWGDLADGMIRYNVGAWDGDRAAPQGFDFDSTVAGVDAGTNPNDEIGISGRLVINFMDPEKGYTCPGCYLGKAKVANVGVGYLTQDYVEDVTTAAAVERTYTVMTVDAFYDADNLTAEAAYFKYDYDVDPLGAPGQKPSGWYAEGAYAMGNIQPAVRYESWDNDGGADYTKIVGGLNYLVSGHDAKIQLAYAAKNSDPGRTIETWTLQLQAQF